MITKRMLMIDGYPVNSRYGQPNDLTLEAIRRAEQDLRNHERRLAWHVAMLAHNGAAPASALLRAPDFLTTPAGERAVHHNMADIALHPTFMRRRRPQHGNQGRVRIPRHKRQIRGSNLPQPPEEV